MEQKTFFFKHFLQRTLFLMVCIVFASSMEAQNSIKGKVVDNQNEPIVGASVVIKGTTSGSVTDIDGNYTLKAKPGDVITFSYVGFKSVSKTVKGNRIDVVLTEDANMLNEVVATGYGAVSRKNLTTSIAKVKADDVIKTGTTNMGQMLMGRAAGLQATLSSAQPGGGVSMTIRGGGQPLYVVDGVVMPTDELVASSGGTTTVLPTSIDRSGLAGINPEDIESIEVLKDASAAIYGINAANGVILITTKQGKKGKMRVSYEGSLSTVNNYKYLKQLNAQDYMTYANVFKKEQYLYNHQMKPYGPNEYDGGNSDAYTADQIANAQTTDWVDYVLKNGSISSHNVTIQGGAERLTYYVSGNYYKQSGTVANSSYERFVLRTNLGAQLFKWLKLNTTINYNKNNNNNGLVGGTSAARGVQAAGILTAALVYPTNLPLYDSEGRYSAYLTIPNPVGMLEMTNRSCWDGFIVNKYPIETATSFQGTDIPLARWADALLLYAEADVRAHNAVSQEAIDCVNLVRHRAGLADLSADKTSSVAAFMDALYMERGHELYYEGCRKVDMIRFGRYYTDMKALGREASSEYFPLPNYAVEQAKQSGYKLTQYYTRDNYDGPKKND